MNNELYLVNMDELLIDHLTEIQLLIYQLKKQTSQYCTLA